MDESSKTHDEHSTLIKAIRALTNVAIRNQEALIKALKIQIGQMSKVLQERGYGSLPSSTETNPKDHVKSITTTEEAETPSIRRLGKLALNKLIIDLADKTVKHPNDRTVKYPKGNVKNVLVGIDKFVFLIDFIILDILEDVKVPLILRRPFLSTAHAKIYVFKRNITLGTGEEKIIFKSVKPAILEDMDAYRDEGMGDVIVGEPFLKEIRIKARKFDGMITIYNGNKQVSYQMVRSHPRFKHHTNEQCSKIPPLLKIYPYGVFMHMIWRIRKTDPYLDTFY
nr:hypothetical protein [Tanacetum cinerariifolium]